MCKVDKNKRPRTVAHPGPQDYNLPSKISEHAQYGFGLRPFIDAQKNRTTTGPGFYDPKYCDGK
jgi:hypothetical protein